MISPVSKGHFAVSRIVALVNKPMVDGCRLGVDAAVLRGATLRSLIEQVPKP